MIILLCLNGNTWAKSFDLYSDWNVELELHSEAQLDHYIDQDCDDISCDDLEDEWRVVDIEGRLKSHIFNHWLVFTDVKWSFGNEDAPIANVL